MKALINTVILAIILVVAVIYLRTIPRDESWDEPAIAEQTSPLAELPDSLRDATEGARPTVEELLLEDTNITALFQTGGELQELWRVADAAKVFETLLARDPDHLDTHLRLVECYADPTMGAEKKSNDHLLAARDIVTRAGVDTLRVAALHRLFVHPVPSLAIERFTELVEANPQDISARLWLAQAFLLDDRAAEAQAQLTELLDGDQTLGRAQGLLVQCMVKLGDIDGAEQLARHLASLYAEEPYPYVLLSTVLLIEGKLKEAVEFCNNALRIDGSYVPAIVARARLYAAGSQREAARVSFEKLLLFEDPMLHAIGWEGIASVDFLSGHFAEATEAMDHAIRLAMSEGSTRRGLIYVFQLVDYLCELGRTDAAGLVLTRWVSNRREIPMHIGRLRVAISAGDTRRARAMLEQIEKERLWRDWMRRLELDLIQYQALAFIGEKRYGRALSVLATQNGEGVVGTSRDYLRGFALFHSGEAERAAPFLRYTRFRQHSVVFPYECDPVSRVQSTFFLAEAALARGEGDDAKKYYEQFLGFWGDADWDLQAVSRARDKLSALSPQGGG